MSKTVKTITNNMDVIKGSTSTFFTGVDDTINLPFDPIATGYAFIWWVELPSWFDQDPDLKYFKTYSQKNFKSFQGIGDIELTTAQAQTGFANREYDVITGVTNQNTDFTIGMKEFSGSPSRKMVQKWIEYIRDSRTGIATYPKTFNTEYGARNHTGQLLYMMVRPDVTNVGHSRIEYAAFYSNVFPTNVPLSTLYNYTQGEQDSPTIDIQFKGFVSNGPQVDAYAQKVLDEQIMNVAEDGEGIPFLDSYGTNTDVTSILNNGKLKEIYGTDDTTK